MNIGLYFGSFNPVHAGHLMIANYLAEYTDLEKIWFVISPQNPFKKRDSLLADYHRLELLRIAIEGYPKFHASDIEFKMPKPSYTIDTLIYLKEKYQDYTFSLIMGADNLLSLQKWKNSEQIISNYDIYVVPRKDAEITNSQKKISKRIKMTESPVIEISSSFIRKSIKEGKDMRYFLPKEVYEYIINMNFYL